MEQFIEMAGADPKQELSVRSVRISFDTRAPSKEEKAAPADTALKLPSWIRQI